MGLRGRQAKFEGLQKKLEDLLKGTMSSGVNYSGKDLLELVKANREGFGITEEEMEDVENNSANYIAKAKKNGVLASPGTRRGYNLA